MENKPNLITSLVSRLKHIGVDIELFGNYPWIYLDKVNGRKVVGKYMSDFGFTAFWYPSLRGEPIKWTDSGAVFKKIRETLNN